MPKCVVFFPFRLAAGQNFRRDLSRGFEQRVFDFTVLIAEKTRFRTFRSARFQTKQLLQRSYLKCTLPSCGLR
jgi:hypothetical protein